MPALVPHPGAAPPWSAPAPLDPPIAAVVEAERAARAAEALSALAARARAAAEEASAQAVVHWRLLDLDWRGGAAAAFNGAVVVRAEQLQDSARRLWDLADEAARRAHLVAGGGW